MARFVTLYSGSSGNSTLIEEDGRYILVDMGRSCRLTQTALKAQGLTPEALAGVLVTHEHSDHVGGLAIFLKYHPVPVYGSAPTLAYLEAHGLVPPGTKLVDIDGRTQEIAGFSVQSFETSHDAVACRGYRVTVPSGGVACVATDLGYVSDEVLANLLLADVVALESNYDREMLMNGPYDYALKMRIASPWGHLSNDECGQTLVRLAQNGCGRFFLCHLSDENNTPERAVGAACAALTEAGIAPGAYTVQAAPRNTAGPACTF